jgi:hypothetical protein
MELNAEQIVIEIQSLIKALKVNNGWWENRGRGGWFNHDILVDALALITSQEQRIKELTVENERLSQSLANTKSILANSKADTVKQMQERLLKEFPHHNGKVFGAIGADTVDWVSKEMLEGEK